MAHPHNQSAADEVLVTGDQTTFSAEEPLYEEAHLPSAPPSPEAAKPTKMRLWHKVLIVVGVVALIIFMTAAGLLMMRQQGPEQTALEPTPSVVPQSQDPIHQRLTALQVQLRAADPAQDSLPLPPVDLMVRMEDQ